MPLAIQDSCGIVVTLNGPDIVPLRDMQGFPVPKEILVDRYPDIIGNTLCRPAVDMLLIAMLKRADPQFELVLTEPL